MRVQLTDVQPGDRLAEDIFTEQGLHVLSRGTVIQERDLHRLHQLRIDDVEIERRIAEEEGTTGFASQARLLPYYDDAVAGCELLFKRALEEGQLRGGDVEASFQPLVDQVKTERDVVSLLLILNNRDDYTYQHSVQVGMLSYYLAKWSGWDEEETTQAGKAGFLHDIGKCRIPDSILNKPGKLTDEEFDEVRRHSVYGFEIIRASFGEGVAATAALQHHERLNGEGYPYRLTAERIEPISRIVAIADVYSAMISDRSYRDKLDMLTVLKKLYQLSFRELDPHMTQTFIRHMLPNFIGKKVEMVNGETGIVVMNHPTLLFHPLVRIGDKFVDSSVDRSFEIKQVFL